MTINSTTRKAGPFVGNGTVSAFPFGFKVFQASDLFVVRLNVSAAVEQTLVLNSDYSVTLNPDQNSNPGGVVTLSSALASGYTLTLTSDVPDTQPTDLTNQGGFYPEVINDALDRATIQIQQVQEEIDRTLTAPISTPVGTNLEFPLPSANKFIGWNSTATGLQNLDASSLASIVAFATAYADTFNGDGVTSTFALSYPPATVRNLDVSINGVTQVPVIDYDINGQALNFTTPPPLGSVVLAKYWQALPNSSGAAQDFTLTPNGYTTAVDVQEGFDDLGSSAGTSKVGFLQAGTGAQARSAQDKLRDTVSVKDFGAVGDGVTDDTAAFRAACYSLQPVSAAIAHRGIYVPPGRYKITDTVYVHAGNVLFGAGMASFIDASGFPLVGTDPVFKLGWWLNGTTPTQDTAVGDLPPEIYGMFVLGGPGGGGAVVDLTFPGGIIHDMWFSAPGTAINLAGGNVFDCLIDGGLTGITVNGSNQRIDNVQFFNPNYGVTLDGACADTSIQGCTFEYCKYEAISVNGAGCDGVKIVGCNFYYNVQYSTIAGSIRLRNNNQTVNVESCQFTNMKGSAIILEQTGTNKKLHVQSCVFNGEKSVAGYAQSTTSAGVFVGSGRAVIQASRFVSLRGYALSFASSAVGNYADCTMSDCVITATDTGIVPNDIGILSTQYGDSLRLNNVTGSGDCPLFAANVYCYPSAIGLQNWFQVENTPGTNFVRLPVTHGASFHVKMRVNTLASGSFDYIKNIYEIIDVSTGYNGVTQESQIDTQVIYQSPTTAPVPDIALTAGFTSIAGPTTLTPPIVGNIILSWPDTYGPADLDIQIN